MVDITRLLKESTGHDWALSEQLVLHEHLLMAEPHEFLLKYLNQFDPEWFGETDGAKYFEESLKL